MFDYVLTNDHIFVSLYIRVCEWYSQFDFARMERCQKWSLVLCCQRRVFAQTWTFRKDSCQWFVMSTRIKKTLGCLIGGYHFRSHLLLFGESPQLINQGLLIRVDIKGDAAIKTTLGVHVHAWSHLFWRSWAPAFRRSVPLSHFKLSLERVGSASPFQQGRRIIDMDDIQTFFKDRNTNISPTITNNHPTQL